MDIPRLKKKNLENQPEREAIKILIHEKLHYLAEGMEDSGWEFVIEEKGITVSRTLSVLENVRGTKGVALLSSTPEQIVDLILDITNWKKWDSHVAEAKVIEEFGDIKVNYMQYHPMFPVSSRDVCFLSSVIKHTEDNGYSVVWLSVSSDVYPKKSGIVRARFYPSGFVIKPLQDLNSCLVTYVLQFDLKGWVPTAVQNGITAQLPLVLYAIEQTLKGQDVVAPILPTIDISSLGETESSNSNSTSVTITTSTTVATVSSSPLSSSPSSTSPSSSPVIGDGQSKLAGDDESSKFIQLIKKGSGSKGDLNEFLSQKSPRKLVSRLAKSHTTSEVDSTPKRDKSPKKKQSPSLTESTQ